MFLFIFCVYHAEYNRAAGEGQDAQEVCPLVVLEEEGHGQQPGRLSGSSKWLLISLCLCETKDEMLHVLTCSNYTSQSIRCV